MLKALFFFFIVAMGFPYTAAAHGPCHAELTVQNPILDPTLKLRDLKDELGQALADKESLKCLLCIRNFAPRADLMNFLDKKFGIEWLDQGKSLLERMISTKTNRDELSADEKLLADSTVYFLAMELNLNEKDIKLDENRRTTIQAAQKIFRIQSEIVEQLRLGAVDTSPFYVAYYTEDYMLSLQRDLSQIEESLRIARDEKDQIKSLLDELNRKGIYLATSDINARVLPTKPDSVWRRLGYEAVPYQVTSP